MRAWLAIIVMLVSLSVAILFASDCKSTMLVQSEAIEEIISEAKAFKFFDQTFQVPVSWPSETEMKVLPMKKVVEGNLTGYTFIQDSYPGMIVYWFIGVEIDSGFTVKSLTQTMYLPGYGTAGCEHWVIASDGTIKQMNCEEFGVFLEALKNGIDGSI